MARKFVYKRLAKKPGIWRVDGIGVVRYSSRGSSRVAVHLSGVPPDQWEAHFTKDSLNGETTSMWIHPASLRHFLVGSVWRDGARVYLPPQEKATLEIDTRQARFYRLRDKIDLNGTIVNNLLPPGFCPMVYENYVALRHTGYYLIPVIDGPVSWLVVPASELLRFYLGTSDRLINAVIQGDLNKYVDWDRSRVENFEPVLHVKRRLTRLEAFVLGRACENEQSAHALFGVHKYLSKTSLKNKTRQEQDLGSIPHILRTEFPFLGRTKLRVSGKRIRLYHDENVSKWAVFAMFIDSCSHPIGFSKVVQESDIPWETNAAGSFVPGGRPQLIPEIEESEKYDVDDLPADATIRRVVAKTFTNQFAGFDRLKFEHQRPLGKPTQGRKPRPGEDPVDNLTVNDGQYTSDAAGAAGISGFDSHAYGTEGGMEEFLAAIDQMKVLPQTAGWKITTRSLENQQNLTLKGERLAHFPERINRVRTWHLVALPSGDTRPRQVVIVEVKVGSGRFYICEMELKGKEAQCTVIVFRLDFEPIEDKEFVELFVLTAIRNRWPEAGKVWENMDDFKRAGLFFLGHAITRVHHPAEKTNKANNSKVPVTPASWAQSLVNAILDEVTPRMPA